VTVRPIEVGFEASAPRPRPLYMGPPLMNFGLLSKNLRLPPGRGYGSPEETFAPTCFSCPDKKLSSTQ
jgi:hypothetical protein